jgi:2-iminobutanoate/2-iminopropanoate deaminase
MKKAIKIPNAPAPIGPYSQAILKNDTLYVSGQIPIDTKTGTLINHNIREATQKVLENIGELLNEADMQYSDVVKCSIFLNNFEDFKEMNDVYATFFSENPPARETVEVSRLPMNAIIEISCIALK